MTEDFDYNGKIEELLQGKLNEGDLSIPDLLDAYELSAYLTGALIPSNGEENGELSPIETDPEYWYLHSTEETWPTKVNNIPVAYVQVISPKVVLRHSISQKIRSDGLIAYFFVISSVDGLRPGQTGTSAKRVIAKQNKIMMIQANGNQYHAPDKDIARPFIADEGIDCYKVMYENIVDGIDLKTHDHRPLYVPINDVKIYIPNR